MKKLMTMALLVVALAATSCDKEGGECKCSYTVGNLELKDQEVDLEGTNLTCAEYEESMSGKYTNVKCRADN